MAEGTSVRSPVALFLFNRPDVTQRIFDAIAQARPARLLVVADGARADRPGETEQCRTARAVIERIDWPCRVQTNFSDTNLGCKRRVASGLDWVFSQADRAIVLEDDCLPVPEFFAFCDELLERYRDEPRVHMIRGSNFLGGRRASADSYYFSRFYNIWGWASWARAWSHYDIGMQRWPELRDTGWLQKRLEPQMVPLVRHFFDETHAGRVDTWDYQWMLCGWLQDALAAVPETNLIANLGHGEAATHTGNRGSHLANLAAGALQLPLRHPAGVSRLAAADELEWNRVYPAHRVRRGWRRWLGN
jgi:hypothetical protein